MRRPAGFSNLLVFMSTFARQIVPVVQSKRCLHVEGVRVEYAQLAKTIHKKTKRRVMRDMGVQKSRRS